MLLSFITAVILFFALTPASPTVPKNLQTQAELPIDLKIEVPAKLSISLATVNFAPLELKKALKVLSASIDVESLLDKYSMEFGVDKNLLKKIANCESHFNTGSKNGDYGGMFQFSTGTWIGTRNQMGLDSNPDLRFSGEEAIKTAAFKISRGGVGAWPACSKV